MKIITLSGLDGSGKSTQKDLLQNWLEAAGKKVFPFHAVKFGTAQKIIDWQNRYCLLCRILPKCKLKEAKEKSVTQANWFQIQLRKLFLVIDVWRFKKIRETLEKGGYDFILSDRYFHDSLINLKYLQEENNLTDEEASFLEKVRPEVGIYLQADPEKIMQRERKPDQGIDYLQKKNGLYENMASIWNFKTINGNRNKEEIFEEIKSLL